MQQLSSANFILLNLQKFASDMHIIYKLELACAGNEHPIALGIKKSIETNLPVDIILSNIRSMAETNFSAISDIIGVDLTNEILKQ